MLAFCWFRRAVFSLGREREATAGLVSCEGDVRHEASQGSLCPPTPAFLTCSSVSLHCTSTAASAAL